MSPTVPKHDRRDRAALFRQRLARGMQDSGLSQSALARAVGVDRSTVSQLLSATATRLPNAQVAAECAQALGVSADWLLGLTDRPERSAELLAASLTVTEAPRALVDETIFAWHQEAAGYKIRHVPATLPDMLAARSDYEIALPLFELDSFARGEGYYRGLDRAIRVEQIDHLIALSEQMYPSLRLYLFDARRVFSAPLTVFGPLLAVLYLGRHYLAFRDSLRVAVFVGHFDTLVREAAVAARDIPAHLRALRAEI
jgi:transcriptional regulator with XRE-family HTH domain